jgi:hypothetical protein
MGQQQLLLIVLGVIIVGIAIVVGINLFNANAEESTKDTIVSEGTNLGAMAQQYYKKPTAMGGGGNSFAGFIPAKVSSKLTSTPTTTWSWTDPSTATSFVMTGTPKDADYSTKWKVEVTVTKDSIVSKITNL